MTESLLQIATALSASTALSIVVKATLALGLAMLAVRCACRTSASTRHLILAATFAALVALPLAAVLAPPITVEVPRPPALSLAEMAPVVIPDAPAHAGVAANHEVRVAAAGRSVLSPSDSIGLAWAVGVLFFLVPVAITPWRLRQLQRAARPWPQADTIIRPLAVAAGIGRPVALLVHDGVSSPLTCGTRRPVVVLPAEARSWSDEELQQALTHELEHIRRADWAVHVATRIICALYWFHPLVWVVWRRLGLESERACDDSVLRVADRAAYAGQLVRLARRRVRHPAVPALAMAGGSDLSARVSALLDQTQVRGPLRAPVAFAIVAIAGAMVAAVAPLRASTAVGMQAGDVPVKRPAFAVVSIRKNTSGADEWYMRSLPGGRIVAMNQTVRALIQFAYALRPQQLAGGPDWLDRDRFDIVAQAEGEIPPSPPGGPPGPAMLMMQQLLADRFNLVVRIEKRELPIYALTLARSNGQLGPRIQPAQTDCAVVMAALLKQSASGGVAPAPPRLADGRPACGSTVQGGRMFAGGTMLAQLAGNLSGRVGRIVEDRTGLTGAFDFDVEFAPETAGAPAPPGAPSDAAPAASDRPSLFTALEEQLGLKLQPLRAPVDVTVIDRLDPPTEN